MRNITSALHNPQQTQTYPAQRKKKAPLLPGRTCLFHHDYNIWISPEYTFTDITAQFLIFFT